MSSPKYKKIADEMFESNSSLFKEYVEIMDKYDLDKNQFKDRALELQRKLLRIIKIAEDKLCMHSETNGYANYSSTLADKFWMEVRIRMPRIDDYIES